MAPPCPHTARSPARTWTGSAPPRPVCRGRSVLPGLASQHPSTDARSHLGRRRDELPRDRRPAQSPGLSSPTAVAVITRKDRAKMAPSARHVIGYGEGHAHEHISQLNLTTSPRCNRVKLPTPRRGSRPTILIFCTYDCFTLPYSCKSRIGFCGKGEGGAWLASGISRPVAASP